MAKPIDYSKIYDSNNFGKFIILEQLPNTSKSGHRIVKIKFLDTGTIKTVRLADAMVGNIRDDYRPNICGVACIGNASSYDSAYNLWNGMIQRCYNQNTSNYNRYGGKGITVCKRWLCFEYFLQDLPLIDGYNEWANSRGLYQLDKDYKQQGIPYNKRVYSLETCCFLQNADNSSMMSQAEYIGVRSTGNSYNANIYYNGHYRNLGTFQREEDAAAAYNNAANFLYTDRKVLNNVPHVNSKKLESIKLRHIEMCKIIKPNQSK